MSESPDAIVVGTGLAGSIASVRLASAGLRVLALDAGAGGSASWSGCGDVFGPRSAPAAAAHSTDVAGLIGAARTESGPGERGPSTSRRRELLRALFPRHPWVRLGAGDDEVRRLVSRGIELLGIPARACESGTWVLTTAALLRRADVVADGMACVGEAPVRIACVEGLAEPDATWATRAWTAGGGQVTSAGRVAVGNEPHDSTLSLATWISSLPEAAQESVLAGLLPEGGPTVVLPPILGLTFEIAARLRGLRGGALEMAGAIGAPWGTRLVRALEARRASTGVRAGGPVIATPERSGARWRVQTGSGTWSAPFLLIAAGGLSGRDGRCGWLAPWIGAPSRSGDEVASSPWMPQPFLARGLPVEEGLRVRTSGATRAVEGLYAAGAVLDGHDPAHDGTGFGVAAATALIAAEALLDASGRAGGGAP